MMLTRISISSRKVEAIHAFKLNKESKQCDKSRALSRFIDDCQLNMAQNM